MRSIARRTSREVKERNRIEGTRADNRRRDEIHSDGCLRVCLFARVRSKAASSPGCDRGNVLLNESKNRYPPLTTD